MCICPFSSKIIQEIKYYHLKRPTRCDVEAVLDESSAKMQCHILLSITAGLNFSFTLPKLFFFAYF